MITTPARVLEEAAALVAARQPFVLVTVVGRRAPSSGRTGGRAIVLPDGTVRGWIGGACAEPTVLAEARASLGSGETVLLRLGEGGPAPDMGEHVHHVAMACESDGALDILLEPVVPAVRLVVVGRSPAVDALAAMGAALGWDPVVVDEGGDPASHANPSIVRTKLDLDTVVTDPACAVVVATQGHYDDLALAAALATPAGYIGLVASARRAATVREHLRDDGHDDAALARIEAPAGIDLGSTEHVEVAASVIADLVRRRAAGELALDGGAAPAAPTMAIDPICGMTVDPAEAKYHSLHDGTDFWFCASGCKRAFDADPEAALAAS
ncbi:MAG TPA: XdhC family protein [Acidimicrobiales bacterium]|nr:XdhC family protein [Acidimicrobiales bacterium]